MNINTKYILFKSKLILLILLKFDIRVYLECPMPVFPLGNGYENISYRVRSMIIIRTKCFKYHTNYI